MQLEFYVGQDEEEFFLRLPGSAGTLRWIFQGSCWTSEPAKLPDGAFPVQFGHLPGALQEEMLAWVARAEALGHRYWSEQN